MALHGREPEQATIADLLAQARAGAGGSLLLSGEPGAGKSALLSEAAGAAGAAGEMTVLSTAGIESEAPLAFAALQRLLRPVMAEQRGIPEPQWRALRIAFGEESGEAGDRFLVFLGALSLLAEAAEEAPVLVTVDDVQWLDDASAAALQFVARRIGREPIALLWAARQDDAAAALLADLPILTLAGLGLVGASAVLAEGASGEVSPEVAALLLATTGGNPLALRELPEVLTPRQLAGDEPLPPRLPVTERIERAFLDRARRLSEDAQGLLLVVAADDSARVAVVLAAAAALGTSGDALGEIERSGLVTMTETAVDLRHPLVRSAVYNAAPSAERRRVHAALATALTREEDADRRAWHRAASVTRPDETVVDELVDAAERAERRGGHEAASAAWARAAELSTSASVRAEYLFSAARAAWVSAHPARARGLVDSAVAEATRPQLRADTRRLQGRIEWNTGSVPLAHRILLEAAAEVAPHDEVRARELATEAVAISAWGGGSGLDIDAAALVAAPDADAPARQRCYAEMLQGLTRVVAGDWEAAAVPLRRSFEIHRELPGDFELLPNLSIAAFHLGDHDEAEAYLERLLAEARTSGVVVMVLYALTRLVMVDLAAGRWADVASRATEAVTLGEETGHGILADTPRSLLLLLAALRGDDAFDDLAADLDLATARGTSGILDVVMRDVVHWAHGVRLLTTAPATAFHRLAQMSHAVPRRLAGTDRLEAAVRADQRQAARLWVDDLATFGHATGHAWPAAIAEHGEALLAEPDAVERHFVRALELHGEHAVGGRPYDRARTQLAYGEHLRRMRRRVDARVQLRAALDTFGDLRAGPWVERATHELRASGETVRRREDTDDVTLTPQERQVAQLVRQGLSNKDVAAQLFVSPRTVDFHLRNVFTKTGVTSRLELVGIALD